MGQQPTGFRDLLNSMMRRRWFITALVLGSFILIVGGIFTAIEIGSPMANEWKELLLLMLGAFIGSYSKIIDYWFSDVDKDKMLVQKMDEEDGVSMSNTNSIKNEVEGHKNCDHEWVDNNSDGELECLKCGLLKNEI